MQVERGVLRRLTAYCDRHGISRPKLLRLIIERFLDEADAGDK